MKISVIVPVYNEEQLLSKKLAYFNKLSAISQLVFIDGKSTDHTASLLRAHGFMVVNSCLTSRGKQLSLGITNTTNDTIIFHHFDSVLPDDAFTLIEYALKNKHWGRFDVTIKDKAWMFRVIELLMNGRSRFTAIATGDQAIFVRRGICQEYVTALDTLPIMEDIYLSKQLKKTGRPACIKTPIQVSSRYWRKHGILKSIFNMWRFRFLYFIGVSPNRLYHLYYS